MGSRSARLLGSCVVGDSHPPIRQWRPVQGYRRQDVGTKAHRTGKSCVSRGSGVNLSPSHPRLHVPSYGAVTGSSSGRIPAVRRGSKWAGAESNRRHADFQSAALPPELPARESAATQITVILCPTAHMASTRAGGHPLESSDPSRSVPPRTPGTDETDGGLPVRLLDGPGLRSN